jgi:hypothetical protein
MKRTLLAAIPATLAFVVFSGVASANPRQPCYYGYGCGGFCLNMFAKMHQHGPLFNYGPYYGYPPFEPYGPWNAYLQYNPWYYGMPYGHGHCHNGLGLKDKLHGLFHKHGCGGCGLAEGWHSHFKHGGWFNGHGCFSGCRKGDKHGGDGCGHENGGLFHKPHGKGCDPGCAPACPPADCKAAAFDPETTDPVTRYAGAGSPIQSAGFYAGLPTLDPGVTPVSGVGR